MFVLIYLFVFVCVVVYFWLFVFVCLFVCLFLFACARTHKTFSFSIIQDVSLGTWLAPLDVLRIHDTRFDTEWKVRQADSLANTFFSEHHISLIFFFFASRPEGVKTNS